MAAKGKTVIELYQNCKEKKNCNEKIAKLK